MSLSTNNKEAMQQHNPSVNQTSPAVEKFFSHLAIGIIGGSLYGSYVGYQEANKIIAKASSKVKQSVTPGRLRLYSCFQHGTRYAINLSIFTGIYAGTDLLLRYKIRKTPGPDPYNKIIAGTVAGSLFGGLSSIAFAERTLKNVFRLTGIGFAVGLGFGVVMGLIQVPNEKRKEELNLEKTEVQRVKRHYETKVVLQNLKNFVEEEKEVLEELDHLKLDDTAEGKFKEIQERLQKELNSNRKS